MTGMNHHDPDVA